MFSILFLNTNPKTLHSVDMDIEKLIAVTSTYMRNKQLDNLLPSPLPVSNEKSHWGQITTLMFGEFNRVKSLNIYNLWVRGGQFKQKVIQSLSNLEKSDSENSFERGNVEIFIYCLHLIAFYM